MPRYHLGARPVLRHAVMDFPVFSLCENHGAPFRGRSRASVTVPMSVRTARRVNDIAERILPGEARIAAG